MSKSNKNAARLALALAITAAPGMARAGSSIDLGHDSDSKTTFVWLGWEQPKNANRQMMLFVQKGGSINGQNFSDGLEVRFEKADLKLLKWCAIATTEAERDRGKKCTPDKMLKPGATIKVP